MAWHPSSLPVYPCRTTKGHERVIIRLVERLHDVTQLRIYKPTLLRGSLDNPLRAHALAAVPNFPVQTIKSAPASIMYRLAAYGQPSFRQQFGLYHKLNAPVRLTKCPHV